MAIQMGLLPSRARPNSYPESYNGLPTDSLLLLHNADGVQDVVANMSGITWPQHALAVANNASMNLFTSGSQGVFYLLGFHLSVTLTGEYQILFGAGIMWDGLVYTGSINAPIFPLGGIRASGASQQVAVKNISGGASDIWINLFGANAEH